MQDRPTANRVRGSTDMPTEKEVIARVGKPMYMRHASVAKWGECNICNEIFPIPRNVREYHA